MKATIPIALQPGTRAVRLERVAAESNKLEDWVLSDEHIHGAWKLWIAHNLTLTLGTYLLLHDDGSIEQVTVNPDGTERVIQIKARD